MEVRVFTSIPEIPQSIASQFSYPAVQNYFLSLDWFACVFETALYASMSPRIYSLFDTDNSAIGLLYCATKKGERTLYSLSNFYTMEYGLVTSTDAGLEQSCTDCLVEYIQSERPTWNAIDFRYLLAADSIEPKFPAVFEQQGFSVANYFMYENWYVLTCERDFDTYYSGLSSRLRNTIKRKEKKLNKAHEVEIKIHASDYSDLEKATADYVAIYNKSWKNPEPFPDFIPSFISTLSELGILRLGLLYIDGNPAAAQLWINTKNKALIYKLAYDEEYSSHSPGSILSREMFRYAMDIDAVAEIDYGVGSEGYKKDWMDAVRELKGMQAYNKKTVVGRLLAINQYARATIKRLVRKKQ
ncbi:MAG: hypothetical protein ACI9NT_002430 [Bacteroidia bacterium]|jgi:hypothetical protein